MAEPKKRLTSTRSGARRSHLGLKAIILGNCPKCQSPISPHSICSNCGYYKGKDILKLEEKTKAKEKRRKDREDKDSAEETPTGSQGSDRSDGKDAKGAK